MGVINCELGIEPAEEHRKRAWELCCGTTTGIEMVQVSCHPHVWNGAQGLGRGGAQLMTSWASGKPELHLSDFNE